MKRDNLKSVEDRERTRIDPETIDFGKLIIKLIILTILLMILYVLYPGSFEHILNGQSGQIMPGPVKSSPAPKLPANIE